MTGVLRFCKGLFTAAVMVLLILLALVPVVVLVALKIMAPTRHLKSSVTGLLTGFCEWWVDSCRRSYMLIHPAAWLAKLPDNLSRSKSYLVLCNHICWADIPVLVFSINGHVPFVKFFMKKVMVALPILGWGAWGLDFPLLHRYSREKLEAHPELRNRDAETLAEFCQRLRERHGAISIFIEGTRYTPEKHDRQQSPYEHLLRPKAGGVGIVLENFGEEVNEYLDATIVYSKDTGRFWDFFCGGEGAHITIDCRPIPRDLASNYSQDLDSAREATKAWIEQVWRDKDRKIAEFKRRGTWES